MARAASREISVRLLRFRADRRSIGGMTIHDVPRSVTDVTTNLLDPEEVAEWAYKLILEGKEPVRDWLWEATERGRLGTLTAEDSERMIALGQSVATVSMLLEEIPDFLVELILMMAPSVLISIGHKDNERIVRIALTDESGEDELFVLAF